MNTVEGVLLKTQLGSSNEMPDPVFFFSLMACIRWAISQIIPFHHEILTDHKPKRNTACCHKLKSLKLYSKRNLSYFQIDCYNDIMIRNTLKKQIFLRFSFTCSRVQTKFKGTVIFIHSYFYSSCTSGDFMTKNKCSLIYL